MSIKHLALTNFRNYEKYAVDFNRINIFIGPNGIGKTNILEAIWFLASGRTWRTNHDDEVIEWGKDFAKISAQITRDSKNIVLELILQDKKTFKINSVKKHLIEILGRLPAVIFSPEAIQMIDGAPALRRRFLDILLCQIDKKFTLCLLDYNKILKGRNRLLGDIKFGKSKEDELEFWDEKLVTLGNFLVKKRKEAIKFINESLTGVYQEISGKSETLSIRYKGTIEEEKFGEYLIANREREIEQSATLFGPHRDDFVILLNGKDIASFGSRGEFRSATLALKILELRYLTEEKGEKPILLLDDIFSELDKKRRMHLAKIVENQQTIITTTDLDHIEKELRGKARIVELK
ncbi:hypothetical protein A2V71_02265 [Candidatus Berkelbacteria bacterium RBG_13_40_8]|uniref:DNA replication and repair protein RecF n=1 Tax=Candidatus Berkelbacteria bacterium RBG_13_40_8 TaxID=1797467 RepID=A0A1F5DPY9_9BACT|nr:MAG: hypothetical protein A2V71_02265 [Candidatus Berkelbacteria bacterium RBG_13_40_8]